MNVSVIIPFFCGVGWLEEAIQSVLNQTYRVFEIIVVNDGSSEDISYLEEKYREKVRFVFQDNAGAAAARNHGIRISTGEIIAFLDSDDLWEKNKVEIQLAQMLETGCKWSTTGYTTFGVVKQKTVIPYHSTSPCWKHIYNTSKIATPTVMIIKDILDANPFDIDMRKGQDNCLWYKLSAEYPLDVCHEVLVKVRIREESTSLNVKAHIHARALLWKKMVQKHELKEPNRLLTKLGYSICFFSDLKVNNQKVQFVLFALAWIVFRLDDCILNIVEPTL